MCIWATIVSVRGRIQDLVRGGVDQNLKKVIFYILPINIDIDWNCNFVGYYTIPFGFSLFWHFLVISFKLFNTSLAKDHLRGFNTRNAHMVHIINNPIKNGVYILVEVSIWISWSMSWIENILCFWSLNYFGERSEQEEDSLYISKMKHICQYNKEFSKIRVISVYFANFRGGVRRLRLLWIHHWYMRDNI